MAIAYGKFNVEIEAASKQAVSNMELKQFIHDIRSPLSAINVCISQIEKNAIGQETLELMKLAYTHMVEMTAQSKNTETIDITQVVENIAKEKKSCFSGKIEIRTYGNSILKNAKLKSGDIKRMLSNVLNNSIEAQASKIKIRIQNKGQKQVILIQDNGHGIHESNLKKIGREPFSHGQKPVGAGLGLGLKHLSETLRSVNGLLKIKSRLNRGTLVCLEI
ncbi:MAG: hypothetical protein BroJett041_23590 [Candidatus Jettenia caeni]|nr:MAG: hypothetical protein BroJett041_23590 [Candidatus Jettenia caeni]